MSAARTRGQRYTLAALAVASPSLNELVSDATDERNPRRSRAMTTTIYELDPVHSHLGFSVRHMMVSQQRGQFAGASGKLTLDRTDLPASHVEVAIEVATVNTNNADRDNHLRSADFF